MNESTLQKYIELIHELTGITISAGRKTMIERRVQKRAGELGFNVAETGYDDYYAYVKKNRGEYPTFIDLVTTNETYFFRTPRIWDYIEARFLPDWFAAHPRKVFQAWSAAASSGEEAHSLGVICQDFKRRNPDFNYRIWGTDISQEMVGLCREGQYRGRSVEAFRTTRPSQFQEHMEEKNDAFVASSEIRSRLKFQTHNLFSKPTTTDVFDLVLIRNVLIYFTRPDQEIVLSKIQPHVADDGVIIIGESESLTHIKTPFETVEPFVYKPARKQAA